jgi:LAO/AO transport system kinase
MSTAAPTSLGARVVAGERRALAQAITLVESTRSDHRAEAAALLDDVLPATGNAVRVGITGTPGAGKSTFIEELGTRLTARGHRVAVLAIDPSSRRSGGSILGDKTRMESLARNPDAFIRPSPSAGTLGGVARRTREAALLCEAAGFDVVVVETVGVGQSEASVADLVDTLAFVATPGGGDTLQFMKAGLLELADVFVVNKADLGASATRTARELEAGVHLSEREAKSWQPPVKLVSARDGTGIDELIAALDAHHGDALATGGLRARRVAGRERFVIDALTRRYGSYGLAKIGGNDGALARMRGDPELGSFGAVEALARAIEGALGASR